MFARDIFKFHKVLIKKCVHFRSLQTHSWLLAGHSKWANIKHIKALKDGQKAAMFTRLSRQIRLAIQEGGGSADIALNSNLRSIVDIALRQNMPMSTIQNTIKKSQQSAKDIKKYILEIRYKQKVFVICVCYTDNFAGVKVDLGSILRKTGATFADVSHMFNDFGIIETTMDTTSKLPKVELEERVMDDAIACGAEEVEIVDAETGAVNFFCSPVELNAVCKAIEIKGYRIEKTEHIYTAKNVVQLTPDELTAYEVFLQKMLNVSGLEDIYDNVHMDENV